MPLSAEEQRKWLLAQGLDPAAYDVVEEPLDAAPAPTALGTTNTMSAGQAFMKKGLRSLIPTLLSLPGVSGGMSVGGTLGSAGGPIGTGIGTLVGGGLGGIATHLLASKAQDKVLEMAQTPEAYAKSQQELALAEKEHPIASQLGDFAPNALAFSPKSLLGAGRLARSLAVGAKPAINDAAAGLQTGVNALVGGGIEAGSQIYQNDDPFDWRRIAGAAALQGAFSSPNALGRRMGFPGEVDVSPRQAQLNELLAQAAAEEAARNQPRKLLPAPAIITPDPAPPVVSDPLGKGYTQLKELIKEAPSDRKPIIQPENPDVIRLRKELEDLKLAVQAHETRFNETAPKIETVERGAVRPEEAIEGGKISFDRPSVGENTTPEVIKEEGFYGREVPPAEVKAKNPKLKSAEEKALRGETLYQGPVEPPAWYKEAMQRRVDAGWNPKWPFVPQDLQNPTFVEAIKSDPSLSAAEKQKILLFADKPLVDNFYQPEKPAQPKPNLATDEDRAFARELASKRGAALVETNEQIPHPEGGFARGDYNPTSRIARLTAGATRDTAPHELGGHTLMEDLRTSQYPADRNAYNAGVKIAGSREALAEAIGKRIVDVNDAPLKSWLQDFWSNTKRLTRIASDEDMVNHLARRARDDRPYVESPELWNDKVRAKLDPEGKLTTAPKPATDDTTPEGDTLYSEPGTGAPKKELSSSFIKQLESPINKLESYGAGTPEHKAAGAARKFLEEKRIYEGRFRNSGHELLGKIQEPEKFMQYRWEKRFNEGKSDIKLSPHDQAISDRLQSELLVPIHDEQRAIGRLVMGERAAKDNPHYTPTPVSQDVIRVFHDTSKNPTLAAKLREDYIAHELKYDPEMPKLAPEARRAKAEASLDSYLRNLNEPHVKGTPEFAAVNTAEGHGLPYSWIEKNPQRMWDRYAERVSRDFAYHKAVAQDPEAKIIYNISDRYGNKITDTKGIKPVTDPALQTLKKMMTGNFEGRNASYQAAESLVRSGLLGVASGVYNHVSGYSQMAPYIPAKDLPNIVTAWKDYAKGLADSFEMGVNRHSTLDIEVKDVGPGYWTDRMRGWANNLRKWQGANFIEQSTRGYHMAVGELQAQTSWARIRNSRAGKEDHKFMQMFGEKGVDYKSTPITANDIKKIAAKFVERVQGTYDERGLPSGLVIPNSPLYWMMSLSKWSVERSNIVKQDIINPILKDMDFGPALKYLLGTTLTGAAIAEIKQLFSNRKSQTPNLTELIEEGGMDDWAHKFAEVNNYASFGGIVGDGIMLLANKAKGYRNRDMGGLPALEAVQETAKGLGDAVEAWHNGEPFLNTFLNFAIDTVVNNVQAARILAAHTTKRGDLADADKRRDLDVHKRLSGQDVPPAGTYTGNKYDRASYKDFKHAKSMDEAKQILDEKIKPRLENLSKDDRKKEIENLKRNSYQTIPSDPKESRAYLDFIKRTQGEKSALELRQEKRAQDLLNRRKSRLIPRR